jgi:HSP20 family protein
MRTQVHRKEAHTPWPSRDGTRSPLSPASTASSTSSSAATRAAFVPPVEVVTRDTDVLVRLELPGVDVENDVEVSVDKGRLVIRGERRDQRGEQQGSYLLRELRYGSFQREFALPEGVTGENVEAHYDQGMLEVVVHEAVRREPEPQQVKIMTKKAQEAIEQAE